MLFAFYSVQSSHLWLTLETFNWNSPSEQLNIQTQKQSVALLSNSQWDPSSPITLPRVTRWSTWVFPKKTVMWQICKAACVWWQCQYFPVGVRRFQTTCCNTCIKPLHRVWLKRTLWTKTLLLIYSGRLLWCSSYVCSKTKSLSSATFHHQAQRQERFPVYLRLNVDGGKYRNNLVLSHVEHFRTYLAPTLCLVSNTTLSPENLISMQVICKCNYVFIAKTIMLHLLSESKLQGGDWGRWQ